MNSTSDESSKSADADALGMDATSARPIQGVEDMITQLVGHRGHRRANQPSLLGEISDEGITRLVRLAYYASQAAEEGRFPRFRLLVRASDIASLPRLSTFNPPVSLIDIGDLRKLAPCASSHDLALEVAESSSEDGQSRLQCIGIVRAYFSLTDRKILSYSPWADYLPRGLMIRVDAPGVIRVTEAACALDLRGAGLADLGNMLSHPPQHWQAQVEGRFNLTDAQRTLLSHLILYFYCPKPRSGT